MPCSHRKLELQAQARAALEAEHNWWKDEVGAPPNLVSASTKAEYKAAILKAAPNQLVVSRAGGGCAGGWQVCCCCPHAAQPLR